jgi:aminopeptidase N
VVDKWFAMQAAAPDHQRGRGAQADGASGLHAENAEPRACADLQLRQRQPVAIPRADGSAYEFWAEYVIKLDAINPQVAARLARGMDRWRRYVPALQAKMKQALEKVAKRKLSNDVSEVITKALAN